MKDRKDVRVVRLSKIPITNHMPLDVNRNPFIDTDYFEALSKEREIQNAAGKYRAVWTRQEGRCYYCGTPILADQNRCIVAMNINEPAIGSNMAYIHAHCADSELDYVKTSDLCYYPSELAALLEKLGNKEVYTEKRYRFEALKTHLWAQTKPNVTMSFKSIEKILGFKLPKASENKEWWFRRWGGGISEAGYASGYSPQRVDFVKRRITFKRNENEVVLFKVPEAFTHGKIPEGAAAELTSFFEYIRGKYGF
jgi:hypothetical protein